MSRSSKPGWRKKGSTPARRPTRERERSSAWQRRRVDEGQTAVFRHRLRLLALVLLAVALVAGFVYAVFWSGKETPIITITVTQCVPAIPPNSYAREDSERLAATNEENLKVCPDEQRGQITGSECLDHLRKQLAEQKPGGPKRDVLIVYLSAHGVVDEENQPCLLFSDADPLDSSTWLSVSELLDCVKQQGRESDSSRTVLVLDSGRIDDDWSLGILYNAFAERLSQTIKAAAVKNLYVLNAAGPGQVAWPAPELNGTVFGYFFAEGLGGDARGDDNKITLGELHRYLVEHVGRWTMNNRAAIQQPTLIPKVSKETDFSIAFGGPKGSLRPAKEFIAARRAELSESQRELQRLWQQRDSVLDERKLHRTDPVGLADLEHKLLRATQLLLAGKDYRNELTESLGEIDYALQHIGRTPLPQGLAACSLPLAMRLEEIPENTEQRSKVIQAWQAAGGKPKLKEGDPEPLPLSYLASADIGWNWLAEQQSPGREQLQETIEYVRGSKVREANGRLHGAEVGGGGSADILEVQFLGILERHLDWLATAPEDDAPLREAVGRAISIRRQTEQAAAPADERVHYWVQSLVEQIDRQRRDAEDLLFVGSGSSLLDANEVWDALTNEQGDGRCGAALERARVVSQYLALRDQSWAESPYLAQWLLGQLRAGPSVQIGDDLPALADSLFRLIDRTHDLGNELDQGLFDPDAELPSTLVEAAADVETLHDELKRAHLAYCGYLQGPAGGDRPTLRAIGSILSTPLLDSERRAKLAERYLEILFLEGGFDRVDGADEGEDAGADEVLAEAQAFQDRLTEYVKRAGGWSEHPALAILDRSKLNLLPELRRDAGDSRQPGESDLAWLSRQGGQVRSLLNHTLQDSNELTNVTDKRLEEADETAANARAGLSQADRLVRASASLLASRIWKDAETNPAHQLRLVDWHFLLIWHARRALDDFWDSLADGDSRPYFAATANAYLDSARILNDTPRSLRHGQEDLETLLQRREQAAQAVSVASPDVRTLDEETTAAHEVKVTWHRDLPAGTAVIYLQSIQGADDAARLLPVMDEAETKTIRREAQGVSDASPESLVRHRLVLAGVRRDGDRADADAIAFYRGHVFRDRFHIRRPAYATNVDIIPDTLRSAKITVRGEGERTGHVMFVFDCSGSMDAARRIFTAKDSLKAVLGSLRTEGRYEVGLRAYGRRAKFTDENDCSKKSFIDPRFKGKVHPDLDVERLVSMRPLDKAQHGAILAQMPDLQPCGQTPLYYALKLAFQEDDFILAKKDEPKHMVVITDGLNFQTNCLTIEKVGKPTTKADVLKIREQMNPYRDVQIDIVGLDMVRLRQQGTAEQQSQLAELEQLARATGGDYYDAADTATLTKALREALRLVEYSVSGPGADEAGVERMDLGTSWVVPNVPPSPTPYVVQLHGVDRAPSAVVQIEGGEATELACDKANNQLVYPRYDPRSYDPRDDKRGREHEVKDPLGSGTYVVQAMLPQRFGNDVHFFVYVQHIDPLTFTTRPKHVWAEIRPAGTSSDRVFRFFDLDFVPERPVPVFRFVAQDWPKEEKDAEIKLWFQFEADGAKPDWRGDVDPLRPSKFQADAFPNVSFELRTEGIEPEGHRVVVVEWHPMDGELVPARVQTRPLPDRITHKTFAGVNVVKHQFDFARQTPAAVEITARDTITDEAIEVPPLRVAIEE